MNNLLELAVRIFNDTLPKSCDAAFLYSQTPQNQPSVAIAGKKIVKNNLADKLLIMPPLKQITYDMCRNFI